MSMFKKKICKECKKERKFFIGSERDKQDICGECWDWEDHP